MQKSSISIRRGAMAVAAVSAAAAVMTGCRASDTGPGSPVSIGVPRSPGTAAKPCAAGSLKTTAYQAADRPVGTGTGAAIVQFTNTGAKSCVLQGHPTVAGAANGSPELNVPLQVSPVGSASPVRLTPGAHAWLKLTFVQVQGEGDGYCESGSAPVVYPTVVIGLPNSGAHQVALDDGQFAECDGTLTATAVTATKPS
ncbi:DUF4232 domain-containing protein [Streptomyces prunicolor]|uniref:DUF4232 domain-containing protein n=1 Tax=Streptomyces prunicolor TaxID=67348 RepID=UPI0034145AD8